MGEIGVAFWISVTGYLINDRSSVEGGFGFTLLRDIVNSFYGIKGFGIC